LPFWLRVVGVGVVVAGAVTVTVASLPLSITRVNEAVSGYSQRISVVSKHNQDV